MSKMLEDYVPVNERVKAFYEAYPDGAIMTDLIDTGEAVRVRAVAYRYFEVRQPPGTCVGSLGGNAGR